MVFELFVREAISESQFLSQAYEYFLLTEKNPSLANLQSLQFNIHCEPLLYLCGIKRMNMCRELSKGN